MFSAGFDFEEAGVLGGRTEDFGSDFGTPTEPCVEDLSTVPGREGPVAIDRDPIPFCFRGRAPERADGQKPCLAFLIGPSSPDSKGLFFGISLGP